METEKVIPAKRNENNKRRMKIMKKLVVTDKKACMACLACVDACSTAFYKEFDPAKSCIQIVAGKDGEPKTNTCLQCGKCARTCKQGAIKQNAKGVYMIDKKLCTGCGECVKKCPKKAITLSVRKHVRDANAKVGTTMVEPAVPKE